MNKTKWPLRKISSFTNVVTGGTPSTAEKSYWEDGQIPWLNSGELNQGIVTTCSNFITEAGLKNSSARLMSSGTVLIALTGATTGVSALLTFEACGNQSVTGILPSEAHDERYLYYYLRSIRKRIIDDSWGGAQKHISQQYVKDIEVPLPSLDEQKRIADVLEKTDRLRQKDRQLLAHYDQLLQSVFLSMFGELERNSKGFEMTALGDVLANIQIGPFGSLLHVEDYVTGGIPLVNPTHIKNLKIQPAEDFTVAPEKYKSLKNYHLKTGDIVLGRRGEMGRCALVTEKENGWLCGTGSLFLTPSEKISSVYLTYLLSRESTKRRLEKEAKGTTMANLNRTIIKNFKIPIPPIDVQDTFAEFTVKLENQLEQVLKGIEMSDVLFQSLLQKAFKGELQLRCDRAIEEVNAKPKFVISSIL